LISCAITTAALVTVTILSTRALATARDGFFNSLKPAAPHWGRAARRHGVNAAALGWDNAVCWLGGVICFYRALLGVGELLLRSHICGRALLVLTVASFAVVGRIFQN
jgi:hypothetical protein